MEEWRNVKGYEGYYEVCSDGNIRNAKTKQVLIGSISKCGYRKFIACKNCVRKTLLLHRVVAEAFIDNPMLFPVVNHKNCIKIDNRVENLEWCTDSYNREHAKLNGRMKLSPEHARKMHEASKKSCSKAVQILNLQGEVIGEYISCVEAARAMNTSLKNISRWATGERNCSRGYKVKYKEAI